MKSPPTTSISQLAKTKSQKELVSSILKRGKTEAVILTTSESRQLDAMLRADPYWGAKGKNPYRDLSGQALSLIL